MCVSGGVLYSRLYLLGGVLHAYLMGAVTVRFGGIYLHVHVCSSTFVPISPFASHFVPARITSQYRITRGVSGKKKKKRRVE